MYDAAGHRTKVQDNFNGVTSNVYDANGNLTQQEFGGTGQTPMRIDQSYNANNQLNDVTRYSDLAGTTKVATTSHVYDVAGELTSQMDKTGGGTNIANYTWVYDAAGRLTSETLNSGSPVTYTYDADNQLTGDTVATHTYDAEGNRTGTGYSTGTGNELQSDPGWNYSYDATGNETKKVAISGGQTWKYTYDDKNELTSAKLWSADPDYVGTAVLQKEVDYTYDAWGNMASRSDDPDGSGPLTPSLTHYALDGWNPALAGATGTSNFNVWAELDGNNSNALLTRYFHGDHVDQLIGRQDGGVAYWYLTDRLGSVRDVTDNSGTNKDAISYDGWGNITSESGITYRGSYAWTGRQFDVETDLQYNRARWYDPATGRWQSQDPLGFDAGDSNLFRYVANSAPNTLDPSGLQIQKFTGPPNLKMVVTVPAKIELADEAAIQSVGWLPQHVKNGGFIIQHVDVDVQYTIMETVSRVDPPNYGLCVNKIGQVRTITFDRPVTFDNHYEYWEAWQVGDDSYVYPGYIGDGPPYSKPPDPTPTMDTFQLVVSLLAKRPSTGSITESGHARYVEGVKVNWPRNYGFITRVGGLWRTNLPGAAHLPNGWLWSDKNTVAHGLTISWDTTAGSLKVAAAWPQPE
jgi:RHS repeat-associated protein